MREYFVGQRSPIGQLANDTIEVVPEAIKVTVAQIESMDSLAYGEFIRKPGAEAAINYAYEHRYDSPAPSEPETLPPTPTE